MRQIQSKWLKYIYKKYYTYAGMVANILYQVQATKYFLRVAIGTIMYKQPQIITVWESAYDTMLHQLQVM